jgi:hypothetical protein
MRDNAFEARFFIIIAKHLHHICITFASHLLPTPSLDLLNKEKYNKFTHYSYVHYKEHTSTQIGNYTYNTIWGVCVDYLGNTNTLRICIASKRNRDFSLKQKKINKKRLKTGGNFFLPFFFQYSYIFLFLF